MSLTPPFLPFPRSYLSLTSGSLSFSLAEDRHGIQEASGTSSSGSASAPPWEWTDTSSLTPGPPPTWLSIIISAARTHGSNLLPWIRCPFARPRRFEQPANPPSPARSAAYRSLPPPTAAPPFAKRRRDPVVFHPCRTCCRPCRQALRLQGRTARPLTARWSAPSFASSTAPDADRLCPVPRHQVQLSTAVSRLLPWILAAPSPCSPPLLRSIRQDDACSLR